MGPDELDNTGKGTGAGVAAGSALTLYEGTRETDLVNEEIDERILKLLGLDEVFDIDYATYLTLLKEKMVAGRMNDNKMPTEEVEILTNEFKRVKGKVGRFKIKAKKIDAESLGVKGKLPISKDKFFLTETAIIPEKESRDENEDKLLEAVTRINDTLDSIVSILRNQNKFTKQQQEKDRRTVERVGRDKKEADLEKPLNAAKSLAKKVVAPFQSILDRIFRFIGFTFLGYAFNKLIKWFSDPANKEKIEVLGRFLKDWWPTLLLAVGLFATPFGKFVRTIIGTVAKLTLRLARFAIPKLLRFVGQNPKAALALTAVSAAGIGAAVREGQVAEQRKQLDPNAITPEETADTGKTPGPMQLFLESGQKMGLGFQNGGNIFSGLVGSDTGTTVTGAGVDTQALPILGDNNNMLGTGVLRVGELVMTPEQQQRQINMTGVDPRQFVNGKGRKINTQNIRATFGSSIGFNEGGQVFGFNNGGMFGSSIGFNEGGQVFGFNNGGMVGSTAAPFGNFLNRLGSMGLPGTGSVVAPRGSQMGFQNKLLGIPLNRTVINQQAGQRLSPRSVQRYNQSPSAPSIIKPWSHYDSTQVSFPKIKSQSSSGLNLNLQQNVQTIQGAAKRQEVIMRQMGYEPDGYVNLRGQPVNLGPQSRSIPVPGKSPIPVKTSIVVLPPVAAKSPTPPPSQRAPGQVPSVTISSFSESRNRVVAALGLSDVIGVG